MYCLCGINWRIVLMFGRFIELTESRGVELYFVSALIVIEFILGCGMKRNGGVGRDKAIGLPGQVGLILELCLMVYGLFLTIKLGRDSE